MSMRTPAQSRLNPARKRWLSILRQRRSFFPRPKFWKARRPSRVEGLRAHKRQEHFGSWLSENHEGKAAKKVDRVVKCNTDVGSSVQHAPRQAAPSIHESVTW